MNGRRAALISTFLGAGLLGLVCGCPKEAAVRPPVAEEPRVVAPATGAKAKPLPEIDPDKPLKNHQEIDTSTGQHLYGR